MKIQGLNFSKTILVIIVLSITVLSQTNQTQPILGEQPVIDVHWHPPGKAEIPAVIEAMKNLNVKYSIMMGTYSQLEDLKSVNSEQFLPSLVFPCENGKTPNAGLQCFEDNGFLPDIVQLRENIKNGKVKAFGELFAQYVGVAPNDPRLEPYYALAEEFDIPVGIHLGIGAPGIAYNNKGFPPVKSPNYRGKIGDPILLEEVLIRHPKLRLYVMHAAYPFGDEMVYMLYMHPQLYVDISGLQWVIGRPAYYSYLRKLVEAGFLSNAGKRIMFGSDGNPARLKEGVQAILDADFLTAEQKRDILYNNAAKFFKLGDIPKK